MGYSLHNLAHPRGDALGTFGSLNNRKASGYADFWISFAPDSFRTGIKADKGEYHRETLPHQLNAAAEMKTNPKICAYCGQRPGEDKEHVVGRVFYITPPKTGVIVPSCADCNRGRGDGGIRDMHLDEEYMRNVLCIAEGTQFHPVATELSKTKVVRSFRRSVGLAKSVLKATGFTENARPR